MSMTLSLQLIVFLPLIAAIIAGLGGRWIGKTAAKVVTTGALFVGAALSWPIFLNFIAGHAQPQVVPILDWIRSGDMVVAMLAVLRNGAAYVPLDPAFPRDRGLGAIAITDHNEVSGALEAREIAAGMGDIKVIVAEEVKTAEQGEVIGLFLEEKIPKGLTMAETIAEIRRQGGLVYVPHPFDRFHSVPDYEHLLEMVEEIDLLEVFNPRVALTSFNEEAVRFARKYRIVPAAGSDSHVAQGLGSVRQRIHDFDGPAEFLEAMRGADITRKHKNLVYVQTLKFLQTTGRPKAPKRQVHDAKPVRGGRPRRRGEGRRASKS